ncbi:MAG: energy transducer TonB [Bacteroidales bacterium]|nr:energy transducer TonB [Bacteroidales bacterium]
MNPTTKSRPIGILSTIVFNGLLVLIGSIAGLPYLYPPPPELSTVIEFEPEEIEEEQKIEVGTGVQPRSENADPTQDVRLVQNSQGPVEGTRANEARESTVGTEGDVEVPEPERDHEIDTRALFPTADNSDKDTLAAQVADRVTDALTAGHAQGNTRVGNPEGEPSARVQGRSVMGSLPRPVKDNIQKSGVVVVRIQVNREGTVTSAIAGETGTTVTDRTLWKNAEEAAKKAKFNVSRNAPESQQGTITYIFNLR